MFSIAIPRGSIGVHDRMIALKMILEYDRLSIFSLSTRIHRENIQPEKMFT